MNRAGVVGGVLGAAAAVAAGGLAVEHYIVKRSRTRNAPPPRSFDDFAPDRETTVRTEDGVPLYVAEVGPLDAPLTVVFVHGYALSSQSFYFQRHDLAERFGDQVRLVFYDQRSHGRSGESVPQGETIEQLGRDLFSVLSERVPDGPVVIVAHSMGGMTAQRFAEQYPELIGRDARVVGVVLIATSAGGISLVNLGLPAVLGRVPAPITGAVLRTARRRAKLIDSTRRIGTDVAWAFTRRLSFGDKSIAPDLVDFLNAIISATPISAIAAFYPTLVGHDGDIGLKVLRAADVAIVVGDQDVLTPPAHSERMAEALPDATLTVLPGVGHVAQLERPEEVDDVIAGVLERAPRRGRRRRR